MNDNIYLLGVIAVMTAATFATRIFPFVALKGKSEHPLMDYIGKYMPPAVMTILVLYSLKAVDLNNAPYGANELMAMGITAVMHLWKNNFLLSIISGTAFYMAALQYGILW